MSFLGGLEQFRVDQTQFVKIMSAKFWNDFQKINYKASTLINLLKKLPHVVITHTQSKYIILSVILLLLYLISIFLTQFVWIVFFKPQKSSINKNPTGRMSFFCVCWNYNHRNVHIKIFNLLHLRCVFTFIRGKLWKLNPRFKFSLWCYLMDSFLCRHFLFVVIASSCKLSYTDFIIINDIRCFILSLYELDHRIPWQLLLYFN